MTISAASSRAGITVGRIPDAGMAPANILLHYSKRFARVRLCADRLRSRIQDLERAYEPALGGQRSISALMGHSFRLPSRLESREVP
jgi:hypothetical protein